ncbi:hypothetical protein [Serratia marcescens]|uniref:hypothetical protein n=1 Tax=Serratia marcescens TaxID=615 RepID=UPI0003449D41|nr:hypothetical protein [Serratia marcescens]
MATSIEGTGLLQNLIVFVMDDGKYGAAAGEARRLGLNLLMEQGRSAAGVNAPIFDRYLSFSCPLDAFVTDAVRFPPFHRH